MVSEESAPPASKNWDWSRLSIAMQLMAPTFGVWNSGRLEVVRHSKALILVF